MTPSLRVRLFITHALVVVTALAFAIALASREQRRWIVGRSIETLERIGGHATSDLPPAADWDAFADALGASLRYRVTLVDRAGRVLGDSEIPAERLGSIENHAGRPEVRSALAGRVGHDVRHSRSTGVDFLYVAVPAPPGRDVAVLRLAEPLTVIAGLGAALLGTWLVSAALALILTVPLVLWVVERHMARVRALEAVAQRLGRGDAGVRAREHPDDELGRLGRAVNQMAADGRARLEALERERDEREHILVHMSDGVALIDASGRVVRMNRSLAGLLGELLPAEPGTRFTEFVRSPELDDLIQVARAEGRVVETEFRLWSAGGQRYAHAAATPLSSGNRDLVLLVIRDLSDVERLNRVRQDFVANVSHELRTPLTSLRGYAETLLDGGLDDAERREQFVQIIRDQAVRLEALTEDLLTLAELERPGARPRLERVDLREITERQLAAFRPRAAQARLGLALAPGSVVPVTADRRLIEQVLANLLDNAIKYTEAGRVDVSLGEDGEWAWCEVADTGVGIAGEELPRIFERFYRVDRARSRAKGGTGLGLSIVKHIVALHGGEVTVRSTPAGGSVFRFEIPRHGPG